MKTVLVRYKLLADRVAENEKLIDAVFTQLANDQPEGTTYQVYKMPDGVSFMHIACIADGAETHPITSLAAFKAFAAGIKDRVEEGPDTVQLGVVGKYIG